MRGSARDLDRPLPGAAEPACPKTTDHHHAADGAVQPARALVETDGLVVINYYHLTYLKILSPGGRVYMQSTLQKTTRNCQKVTHIRHDTHKVATMIMLCTKLTFYIIYLTQRHKHLVFVPEYPKMCCEDCITGVRSGV